MNPYFSKLWVLGQAAGYLPMRVYLLAALYLFLVLLDIVGLSLLSVWFSKGHEISQIEFLHFDFSHVDDWVLLAVLTCIFVSKFFAAIFVSWILSRKVLKFLSRLRGQVFQRYLELDNSSSDNLKDKLQVILDFTNICGSRIPEALIRFLGEALILFGIIGFLLHRYGGVFVFMVALGAFILTMLVGFFMSHQGSSLGVAITEKQNGIIGISAEVLPKLEEVSVNGYGAWISTKFDNVSLEHATFLARERFVSSIPKYFFELLVFAALIGVISWKSLVAGQQLEAVIVELIVLAIAGLKILPFIGQMVATIYLYKASGPAVHRLGLLFISSRKGTQLNTAKPVDIKTGLRSLIIDETRLELPDGRKLHVPSLKFDAGDVVAVNGPSGIGKSTFLKFLLGLNSEPSSASCVDHDGHLQSISGFSSYLSQIGLIFNESLKDNVVVASDADLDEDRFFQACRNACLSDQFVGQWINKPLGDDGVFISGGERQRVLIARLFYENKPLWFLDEATSALDAINEKKVFDHIITRGDKIVLAISHSSHQSKRYSRYLSIRQDQVVEV